MKCWLMAKHSRSGTLSGCGGRSATPSRTSAYFRTTRCAQNVALHAAKLEGWDARERVKARVAEDVLRLAGPAAWTNSRERYPEPVVRRAAATGRGWRAPWRPTRPSC